MKNYKSPFPSTYEEFIFKSRYARWLDDKGRREDWHETTDRLIEYYANQVWPVDRPRGNEYLEFTETVGEALKQFEVMPSMRALMTAGPVLDRCHVPAYNCAYLPVDSLRSFDEAAYILMCGTGVGFSVETKYVEQLPRLPDEFTDDGPTIVVDDSKEGWATGLRELLHALYEGRNPSWDVSRIRAKGERLRTFGGRASGPAPLVDLFRFVAGICKAAAGRRLSTLEAHDIMCKIAAVVVVGGVRRSAMISLFDCTDQRMGVSKSGAWWEANGQRALANNSGVYKNRRPDAGFFLEKWKELYDSKSGEPGLFSRYACQRIAARNGRRNADFEFGTNPCSEIILRPFQFCNLTEVVVRPSDDLERLRQKCRMAAILGTIQSSFTDFGYLRPIWKETCEEERLLGVSLTGVCDNLELLANPDVLRELRDTVIETNKEWAERLGIAQATATTCVKPSGTVSQLVNASSGLHARHSQYYLRTVRADNKDPITVFLKDAGVYWEADVTAPDTTSVFYFPIETPEASVKRSDQGAIASLELWKTLQDNWCEHKPSATVYFKEDEVLDVAAWVYKNFDDLSGISFLPYDGGTYRQAPYQELTKDEFFKWKEEHPMPEINFDDLRFYETTDQTTGSQELACVGGACEVITVGRVEYDG